jgi:hypothetical protein
MAHISSKDEKRRKEKHEKEKRTQDKRKVELDSVDLAAGPGETKSKATPTIVAVEPRRCEEQSILSEPAITPLTATEPSRLNIVPVAGKLK